MFDKLKIRLFKGLGTPAPRPAAGPGVWEQSPQLTKINSSNSNPIAPVCRLGSSSIVDGV